MDLSPAVREYRTRTVEAGVRPLYTLTLAEARAADLASVRAADGAREPVGQVIDTTAPGPEGPVPVRIYLPIAVAREDPKPVLLYLFGGGWTLGSLETSDGTCRRLTNGVGCVTVAVGYRLAPEHPFPAAVNDCRTVLDWVAGTGLAAALPNDIVIDRARLAIAGDSAGGNLAAATCLLARDRGGPALRTQVLVYPNTEHGADTASMRDNDDPAFFNRRSVAWYWQNYLARPEDGDHPLASPGRAGDLGGLPPALVITAEFDPLRDEGEEYARRLAGAGVPVHLERYPGMMHGFFTMTGLFTQSRQAVDQVVDHLRRRLAVTGPNPDPKEIRDD